MARKRIHVFPYFASGVAFIVRQDNLFFILNHLLCIHSDGVYLHLRWLKNSLDTIMPQVVSYLLK